MQRKFDRMYVTKDLYVIYNWLMEECGYEKLPDVPYERRILEYEDVFPMLYLKYRLKGKNEHRNIKHLVIDEMQDYSYLQYVILHTLFSCRMTILGDKAQTLDETMQDVLLFLPKIFGKKMRTIVLNKSYRNSKSRRMQEQSTRQRIWNCWIGMEKQGRSAFFGGREYAQSHWRKSECGRERL